MQNAINWFEIPTRDYDRAVAFYTRIFDTELTPWTSGEMTMAMFPFDPEKGVGGAIIPPGESKPGADGVVIYLNRGTDLGPALARIEAAGGRVVTPRTKVSDEIGDIALFVDSEGNRIGLHSKN